MNFEGQKGLKEQSRNDNTSQCDTIGAAVNQKMGQMISGVKEISTSLNHAEEDKNIINNRAAF